MSPSLDNSSGALIEIPQHVDIRCDSAYEVVGEPGRKERLRPISPVTQITNDSSNIASPDHTPLDAIGTIFINRHIGINKSNGTKKPASLPTPQNSLHDRSRQQLNRSRSPIRRDRFSSHRREQEEYARRPRRREERRRSNDSSTQHKRERIRIRSESIHNRVPEESSDEMIMMNNNNSCERRRRRQRKEHFRDVDERRREALEHPRSSSHYKAHSEEFRREPEVRKSEERRKESIARSSSFPQESVVEERRREPSRAKSSGRPPKASAAVERRREPTEGMSNSSRPPKDRRRTRESPVETTKSSSGYDVDPTSRLPDMCLKLKAARQVRKERGRISNSFDVQSLSAQTRSTASSGKTASAATMPPRFAYTMDGTPQILMGLGLSCDQQYENRKITATTSSGRQKKSPENKKSSEDKATITQEKTGKTNKNQPKESNKEGGKDACSSEDTMRHLLKLHSKQKKASNKKVGFVGFKKRLSKVG